MTFLARWAPHAIAAAIASATLAAVITSMACAPDQRKVELRKYDELAKERGVIIQQEFLAVMQQLDPQNPPRTPVLTNQMLRIIERYTVFMGRFEKETAAHQSDPRLNEVRQAYKAADSILFYALGEFFSAVDPAISDIQRRAHLAQFSAAYDNGEEALTKAWTLKNR